MAPEKQLPWPWHVIAVNPGAKRRRWGQSPRHTRAISLSFHCQSRLHSRTTDLAGPVSFRTYANVVSLSTSPLPPPPHGPFPSSLTKAVLASDTQCQAAWWSSAVPSGAEPRCFCGAGPSICNKSGWTTAATSPECSLCAEWFPRYRIPSDPFNAGAQYYPHFTGDEIEAYLVNTRLTDPYVSPVTGRLWRSELNQPRSCG